MHKPKNDNSPIPPLPALIFPSKDRSHRAWMSSLKKKRLIRSIGPRLYTSVLNDKVKNVVKGQWTEIVSNLFPKSLLSHRSAIDYRPNKDGEIFLTSTTNRSINYPGLTLHFLRGPPALKDDIAFLNLKASSFARALLENLSASDRKVLPIEDIEARLEQILQLKGEKEINNIRDRAREISKKFKWQREFEKLNGIVGALLGTKDIRNLKSKQGQARAKGSPYDTECFEKLEILFAELRHYPLSEILEGHSDQDHFTNKAFFEAYFSNYIEGTTFEISEAEQIVFEKKIPQKRPKDAHDILGTYQLVSNPNEMRIIPESFEHFENLLKKRHSILMSQRPEALPGQYKIKPNRVGNTHFVPPDYVKGSLKKGFEFYNDLPQGLARAIFMMFLVAEVHPFTDGNGRIARIMMNAELHKKGLTTIIIPNVYREDYLGALRAISRRHRAAHLIQSLSKAHSFSHLNFTSYPKILKLIQARNWFQEPADAQLIYG